MSKIIAANWKMNKLRADAAETAGKLAEGLRTKNVPSDRTVMIFPPATALSTVCEKMKGLAVVGAQNFYPKASGAFTGELSLSMCADCGADWVLVGHSERRHILGESDAFIALKTRYALEQKFGVMLCIGETLEEREGGLLKSVLKRQIDTALSPLRELKRETLLPLLAIAYEPVWAIGTGKVAGEPEVLEAHALVKDLLGDLRDLPVLYGGSVKPGNASSLLALENVDGLLVGGASLEADSFLSIITA